MEREQADSRWFCLEGDKQVGTDEVQHPMVRCAVCSFPFLHLGCRALRVPGQEDTEDIYGLEDIDGEGLTAWLVCDDCFSLACRSADTLRGTNGCFELDGGWIPCNGDVRDNPPTVDQPADLVEASGDSDGCGLGGGHSGWELGQSDSLSGYSATYASGGQGLE